MSALLVGFRVNASVAAGIARVSAARGLPPREVVADAFATGLALIEQDPNPSIGMDGAAAGEHQYRVSLDASAEARVDAARTRVIGRKGAPVVRAFVIRECIVRGLAAVSAHKP